MPAPKPNDRSWMEQQQYLVAVEGSASTADQFLLQFICEGARWEVKRAMQTRLDRRRDDNRKKAREMADFSSTFELDIGARVVSGMRQPTTSRSNSRGANDAEEALRFSDGRQS